MKTLSILLPLVISAALTNAKPVAVENPVKEKVNKVVAVQRISKPMPWQSVRLIGPVILPVANVTLHNETTGQVVVTDGSGNAVLDTAVGDIINALAPNGYKNRLEVTQQAYDRGRSNIYVYNRP
ncbi:hypothetical protein TH53_08405 [Pedobacter lusitanus]|uniref:TonB-dependent receptor n=1 Tax=Pedobacter lusitanus TaxID=1503925 RepID=A0A0D0GK78_9SPHI|nr:hypothetical protein [Pedobacter lusitanus]KIO77652.1 hypothetical protein TH53_08405 [Pedobacter lusitanus]